MVCNFSELLVELTNSSQPATASCITSPAFIATLLYCNCNCNCALLYHVVIYRFRSRCVWSITNSFFIVFVRVAYGPLQTLTSVGLSIFYHFCLRHVWSITNSCVGLSVFYYFCSYRVWSIPEEVGHVHVCYLFVL